MALLVTSISVIVLGVATWQAWPYIQEQYYLGQLDSRVSTQRLHAVEKLAELGSPKTTERLLQLYRDLGSLEVPMRESEENALKRSLTRLCKRWRLACSPYLLAALLSPDSRMRSVTCEVLSSTRAGTPAIMDRLVMLVLEDDHSPVSAYYHAACALGAIEGQRALPVLIKALDSDSLELSEREAVAVAIGAMMGPDAEAAIPSLRNALEVFQYPQGIASALACIGSAAVPCLLEELDHSNPMVRRYAAVSLNDMVVLKRMEPRVAAAALEKLREVHSRESDPIVRLAVYEALEELRDQRAVSKP